MEMKEGILLMPLLFNRPSPRPLPSPFYLPFKIGRLLHHLTLQPQAFTKDRPKNRVLAVRPNHVASKAPGSAKQGIMVNDTPYKPPRRFDLGGDDEGEKDEKGSLPEDDKAGKNLADGNGEGDILFGAD